MGVISNAHSPDIPLVPPLPAGFNKPRKVPTPSTLPRYTSTPSSRTKSKTNSYTSAFGVGIGWGMPRVASGSFLQSVRFEGGRTTDDVRNARLPESSRELQAPTEWRRLRRAQENYRCDQRTERPVGGQGEGGGRVLDREVLWSCSFGDSFVLDIHVPLFMTPSICITGYLF